MKLGKPLENPFHLRNNSYWNTRVQMFFSLYFCCCPHSFSCEQINVKIMHSETQVQNNCQAGVFHNGFLWLLRPKVHSSTSELNFTRQSERGGCGGGGGGRGGIAVRGGGRGRREWVSAWAVTHSQSLQSWVREMRWDGCTSKRCSPLVYSLKSCTPAFLSSHPLALKHK